MKFSRKLLAGAGAVALIAAGGGAAARAGGGSVPSPQPANPRAVPATTLAPIDTSTESKYTPITPCRVVDTRLAVGKIAAGASRNWVVAGTTGFVPQGGTSGGCGVPDSATGVTATVTAVSAAGVGFLRIWPFGSPEPGASFMNFTNTYNVSSGGTLALNAAGAFDVTAKVYSHATHVVIDVTGYYVKPMYAEINTTGPVIRGSRVTGATHLGTGEYEVDFDRDVSACAYNATPFLNPFTIAVEPRAGNPKGVFVYVETPAGLLSDEVFYLDVTC
jgi:hypothetical protein